MMEIIIFFKKSGMRSIIIYDWVAEEWSIGKCSLWINIYTITTGTNTTDLQPLFYLKMATGIIYIYIWPPPPTKLYLYVLKMKFYMA